LIDINISGIDGPFYLGAVLNTIRTIPLQKTTYKANPETGKVEKVSVERFII